VSIPESQLETWSHIGAQVTAKATHESVRKALQGYNFPNGVEYDMFLQGSYKNDTNIYGDMDVDLVVCLTSAFYNNLTQEQKTRMGFTTAQYGHSDFERDVLIALKSQYAQNQLKVKDKAIQVIRPCNGLNCDVVVCAEYRFYTDNLNSYYTGIILWSGMGCEVINYPSYHYNNGVKKHQNTGSWYKPTVRIFKNIRNRLIENKVLSKKEVPSYFIECLLYNVPDSLFGVSFSKTAYNVLEYLENSRNNGLIEKYNCQHNLFNMFGGGNTQWRLDAAKSFINGAIGLWNDWS
jgi:hypothetical protein